MRLTPLLAAIIAATASISISNPGYGQTNSSNSLEEKPASNIDGQPIETSNNIQPSHEESPTAIALPTDSDREISPLVPGETQITEANSGKTSENPVEIVLGETPITETNSPNNLQNAASKTQITEPNSEKINPIQTAQTPTDSPTPSPNSNQPEPRVLVSEVVIDFQNYTGPKEQLQNEIFRVIQTRPGLATTRTQLQSDVNAVFAIGKFSSVNVEPKDTPLGVKITFLVQPNPVLRKVSITPEPSTDRSSIVPQEIIDNIFKDQYGQILNLRSLQEGIKQVNQWYQDKGYTLAQVIDTSNITPDGIVTLAVAEGVIEDIGIRFLDEDGQPKLDDNEQPIPILTDKDEPIGGRTRPFIVTREVELKPGDVFNRQTAERDLRRVFGLGIFDDVRLSFQPGSDPRRVVMVVDVIEKNTGSIAAGGGISSASGLFGSISYQQQNLGGNNQTVGGEFQLGERALLFDLSFTDPWIAGDPYRTSYTVNAFRRRSISLIFDGGDPEIDLPNGDRPRVVRTGGGLNFTRPLSRDVYRRSEWTASAGLEFQHVEIKDADGELSPKDELGNVLSFSDSGKDDLFSLQFGAVRDRRDNPLRPTEGSLLRFGIEQTIPIGSGNIFFSRLRGSYSYYVPVDLTKFTNGPEALAFNIQGGTVIGDLPPYEAFSMGGSNSVRGYAEGDVGSGRSFFQATAEYRFPIISAIGGALFVDFATDLGSGSDVPGDPAGVRGKPGSGFGYGIGVRVQSPLGPIRVDYGFNDQGDSRLHFGIGERF
ncbi:MAG TPA: hypothetical protein DEG17_08555 [Cyanobacteria bacterium UBA11149]|nr:hypothetical protein [Cyanobacteria bacterium UBA11366]HBK63367.1 hypothetical protein [Cyanobacteria bacterium UBA11166]HBR74345.1 hypothetical protein [Cyanobacteria bacterium UBA11159]HBS68697.1 hypothetical protein [Cyanobacteria bacterium UBA11153]HBW88910.1 hypothetical protein [Cyanobacteria bacterium UBA11149]HCA93295.1 hypothetical protein [Cyanobacteria bacterium UBA9226]